MASMSLGTKDLKLIQEFETFQSKMYDHDGGGHCTNGWSHMVYKGKCNGRENEKVFVQRINRKTGDSLLTKDTSKAAKEVNRMIDVPLKQSQFDALVSFADNVDGGNLPNLSKNSKGKDGKLDLAEIPDHMKAYNESSGKVLLGLTRRRQREANLFKEKE